MDGLSTSWIASAVLLVVTVHRRCLATVWRPETEGAPVLHTPEGKKKAIGAESICLLATVLIALVAAVDAVRYALLGSSPAPGQPVPD